MPYVKIKRPACTDFCTCQPMTDQITSPLVINLIIFSLCLVTSSKRAAPASLLAAPSHLCHPKRRKIQPTLVDEPLHTMGEDHVAHQG